jgi:hypothetical protein
MPVIQPHAPRVRPHHDELVQELARHLAGGPDLPPFPEIYEEPLGANTLAVTVLWPEWVGMPDEERTEIILEGYQREKGPPFVLKIGVAVGLTPLEARHLGLRRSG